jgi:hypothetical protein
MTHTTDKVLDRIRKLLRLGESEDMNEAANAVAHAQRLMEEYRLTAAAIGDIWEDETGGADDGSPADRGDLSEAIIGEHTSTSAWRWSLAWSVCHANGCNPWRRGRKPTLTYAYGHGHDLAIVRQMYGYLEQEIERLANLLASGRGRSYKSAFRYGALDEVDRKINAAKREARGQALIAAKHRETAGDSTALVRVNTAIAEIDRIGDEVKAWMRSTMGLRYSSGGSRSVSSGDGYRAGKVAGRSISLHGGARRIGS